MNWPFWLELLARSAALLIAGEVLRRLSRAQSAAFRHRLVLWAFVLLALLPVLSAIFPEIYVPLWRPGNPQRSFVTVQEMSFVVGEGPTQQHLNWPLAVWVTGVLLACVPMLTGAVSVWRSARHATPLRTRSLQEAVRRLRPALPTTVKILISRKLRVPLTCGVVRSRILLPPAAEHWSSSRLHAVLLHELAHVRRRDVAAQLAAHLIAALWWFQPMVWILRRLLRRESELACDAEALRSGFRASDYADELLAIAKAIGPGYSFSSSAISMVQPGDLEERMRAILSPPAARLPLLRMYVIALALGSMAIAASAVSLRPDQALSKGGGSTMKRTILSALLTSAGLSAGTVSGSINDLNGAAISDVHVVIQNPDTGAKQEAVTGSDGKFSLDGASAGQYILRLEKPGFTSIFREFDLKADSKMDREFSMATEGGEQVADKVLGIGEEQAKRVHVGGKVAQSNLMTKVQPVYPKAAKVAGTQGTVEIETTISKDGVPLELRVLSSPSDDLSQASLEAVRQWRYRPTLLNGSPVEIVTDVIVNYTLAR